MPPTANTSRSSRFRRIVGGLVVAGAVVAGGSVMTGHYFHAAQATSNAAAPEQAVAVTVAVVEPRQASLWDEFSGRLEAVNRVELRPRVAGAILSANFTEGALVKAGDVLFKIDPAPYAAEVDKAQAQLEAAKARVVFTAAELERGAQLVSLGLPQVPPGLPSDLLRRRPDIAQAERQVVAADRSLDSARDAFMPSVQLTASGGYVGSTLLEKTPLGIFSVGGSILAPLLDGGRLRAQAGAAAARVGAGIGIWVIAWPYALTG